MHEATTTDLPPPPTAEWPNGRLVTTGQRGNQLSFLRLVVPFRFGDSDPSTLFDETVASLGDEWSTANPRSVDLTLHVANHLCGREDGVRPPVIGGFFRRQGPSVGRLLSKPWIVQSPGRSVDVPFRLTGINLALFRIGLAYIWIDVEPRGANAGDLLDLAHRLRQVRDVERAPKLVRGDEVMTLPDLVESVMPPMLSGSPRLTDDSLAIAYTAAFVSSDGLDEGEVSMVRQRFRRFFHRAQLVVPEECDIDLMPNDLQYRVGQWFWHSMDGGGFLAFDPPEDSFSRGTMSAHLKDCYFLNLQFALMQRDALQLISEKAASAWDLAGDSISDRAEAFRQIRQLLLLFTTQYRFTQIQQRSNHHVDYRRWLEVLEVEALHAELRAEVHDMSAYLDELREYEEAQSRYSEKKQRAAELAAQQTRQRLEDQQRASDLEERRERERLEDQQRADREESDRKQREQEAERRAERDRKITQLVAFFALPTLALTFLGVNISGVTTGDGVSFIVASTVLGLGFVVGAVLGWAIRRRSEGHPESSSPS